MIEVTLSQFFTVVLIGTALIAGIFAAWDRYYCYRSVKAVRRRRVRCRICGANFSRETGQTIQSCPDCGSPNRCGRDRRLG